MAFSISDVKYKNSKENRIENLKRTFAKLGNFDLLTPDIKYSIRKYIYFLIDERGMRNTEWVKLEKMIYEMLEYIINKPWNKITKKDVIINEEQIITEIRNSIIYKTSDKLFLDRNKAFQDVDLEKLIFKSKDRTMEYKKNEMTVEDFFKEFNL